MRKQTQRGKVLHGGSHGKSGVGLARKPVLADATASGASPNFSNCLLRKKLGDPLSSSHQENPFSYHQATGPSPSSNNNQRWEGALVWELKHLGICPASAPR